MMAGASHTRLRSPAQRGGLCEEKYKTSCEDEGIPKSRQRKGNAVMSGGSRWVAAADSCERAKERRKERNLGKESEG